VLGVVGEFRADSRHRHAVIGRSSARRIVAERYSLALRIDNSAAEQQRRNSLENGSDDSFRTRHQHQSDVSDRRPRWLRPSVRHPEPLGTRRASAAIGPARRSRHSRSRRKAASHDITSFSRRQRQRRVIAAGNLRRIGIVIADERQTRSTARAGPDHLRSDSSGSGATMARGMW